MWTSWCIVVDDPEKLAKVVAMPGVSHDPKRGYPILMGSLDTFMSMWKDSFTAHYEGRYIKID